jgi:hypothetical protein
MTNEQWSAFQAFRERFKKQCDIWSAAAQDAGQSGAETWLARLEKQAADADGNPEYQLENAIVYNRNLDAITERDVISLIVVGDNPGKDEQLDINRKYLVGQAGKLGEGFFRRNPELGIDFRTNVIILNKTPIHTAKTKQLSWLLKNGGERFATLFSETQNWMASETMKLRQLLNCPLWLVGYGELRAKGLFAEYAKALSGRQSDEIYLYQHFSMNRFSIDLAEQADKTRSLGENLRTIGTAHRREILGW